MGSKRAQEPKKARRERRAVRILVSRKTLDRASDLAKYRNKPLAEFLSEVVAGAIDENTREYDLAMARIEKRLKDGLDLGTNGELSWNRDDLHAR